MSGIHCCIGHFNGCHWDLGRPPSFCAVVWLPCRDSGEGISEGSRWEIAMTACLKTLGATQKSPGPIPKPSLNQSYLCYELEVWLYQERKSRSRKWRRKKGNSALYFVYPSMPRWAPQVSREIALTMSFWLRCLCIKQNPSGNNVNSSSKMRIFFWSKTSSWEKLPAEVKEAPKEEKNEKHLEGAQAGNWRAWPAARGPDAASGSLLPLSLSSGSDDAIQKKDHRVGGQWAIHLLPPTVFNCVTQGERGGRWLQSLPAKPHLPHGKDHCKTHGPDHPEPIERGSPLTAFNPPSLSFGLNGKDKQV